MYRVIEMFTDLQDNSYRYNVGDEYPRTGYKPSTKRIDELSSANNKRGKPLIKAVQESAESVTEGKPERRKKN
jgi:hypothetical protein